MPAKFSFYNPSRSEPCPVCLGHTGKCRLTREGPVMCGNSLSVVTPPPGYAIGKIVQNFWRMFNPSDRDLSEEAKAEWKREREKREAEARRKEARFQERVLSEAARSQHFEKLIASLSLCDQAVEDLIRREVDIDQALTYGFRSVDAGHDIEKLKLPDTLPGVARSAKNLYNAAGYLCPVKSPEGFVTGFQIRTHESGDYRWLSSEMASQHLANHEVPITVARPVEFRPTNSRFIGMCEGFLKPFIAAQNFNQIILGAAGGQFASSPQTLKRYLSAIHAETAFETIVFYPDAGSVRNPSVLAQYKATWDLLEESGYPLKILWWGQLHKADHKDVDNLSVAELKSLQPRLILADEFWEISKEFAEQEIARVAVLLGFSTPKAALKEVGINEVAASPLSLWRGVLTLQERLGLIAAEARIAKRIQALVAGGAMLPRQEMAKFAAVHGGELDELGMLRKSSLRHLLAFEAQFLVRLNLGLILPIIY